MEIRFVWDERKALANLKKHSISFSEAQECFFDERALVIEDVLHSVDEQRFILIGMSASLNILVVVHVYREEEEVIRLISARVASKRECGQYLRR